MTVIWVAVAAAFVGLIVEFVLLAGGESEEKPR